MKVFVFTATILATFFVLSLFVADVFAQTVSNINASVKISICGNGIIEGGEDCEGSNLNGKSCQDLGFGGGSLSCDISCSYNTSRCIAITPTPTPIVVPSPISSDNGKTTEASSVTPTITPKPTLVPKISVSLPVLVQLFGDPKSGTIQKVQLRTVLSDWISAWKESVAPSVVDSTKKTAISTCDADGDGSCDIKDFSVLLFYAR